jgi:hypothetical protein
MRRKASKPPEATASPPVIPPAMIAIFVVPPFNDPTFVSRKVWITEANAAEEYVGINGELSAIPIGVLLSVNPEFPTIPGGVLLPVNPLFPAWLTTEADVETDSVRRILESRNISLAHLLKDQSESAEMATATVAIKSRSFRETSKSVCPGGAESVKEQVVGLGGNERTSINE